MSELSDDQSQMHLAVKKAGYRLSFSWESLVNQANAGHSEPVGIKWLQRVSWFAGLLLFKTWRGLEKVLRKFRHFEGVFGYECEDAEYRPFKRKTRWVPDERFSDSQ